MKKVIVVALVVALGVTQGYASTNVAPAPVHSPAMTPEQAAAYARDIQKANPDADLTPLMKVVAEQGATGVVIDANPKAWYQTVGGWSLATLTTVVLGGTIYLLVNNRNGDTHIEAGRDVVYGDNGADNSTEEAKQ